MKKIKLAVLSTCLMAATSGAFARDSNDSGEELRRSSEMMKPSTTASSNMTDRTAMPTPMSEADRRAEEFRKNTEMMKPQTFTSPAASDRTPLAAPVREADRKMAEMMERTERMKPN